METKTLNWTCPYPVWGLSRFLLPLTRRTDSDLSVTWSSLGWNTNCGLAKHWLPHALRTASSQLHMGHWCLLKLHIQLSESCPSNTWLFFHQPQGKRKTQWCLSDWRWSTKSKVLSSKNLRSHLSNYLISLSNDWRLSVDPSAAADLSQTAHSTLPLRLATVAHYNNEVGYKCTNITVWTL